MAITAHWRQFLRWWWEQIGSLLPPSWRGSTPGDRMSLMVEFDDAARRTPSRFRLRRCTDAASLGEFSTDESGFAAAQETAAAAGAAAACLRLPQGLLFVKRLTLPAAAESELSRVIAYEIDRETPFSAAELWWTVVVESRDRAAGRIVARLVAAPRTFVADFIAAAERAGVAPTVIEGATTDGTIGRIALAASDPWREGSVPRRIQFAAAACLLLAVAAAAVPFARQSLLLHAIERRIAALRPVVDQANALQRQINATRNARAAAGDTAAADPLAVLTTLTAALPNNAYLDEFSLRAGRLTLNGHARNAAALIDALSAIPVVQDPAFLAPVTIAEGTQTFAIGAVIRAQP